VDSSARGGSPHILCGRPTAVEGHPVYVVDQPLFTISCKSLTYSGRHTPNGSFLMLGLWSCSTLTGSNIRRLRGGSPACAHKTRSAGNPESSIHVGIACLPSRSRC
jgi:hypothetical protein